jgi:cephalosporin hydroxylase
MTYLCELARRHQTDKGGNHLVYGGEPTDCCHNYTPAYDELLSPRRNLVQRVLEIGVNRGCSLRMWAEYFPAAEVIGFDLDPRTLFADGRIRCCQADQASPMSLLDAVSRAGGGPFDLIVDDGSHQWQHQVTTAATLLGLVAPGGVYVVEDLAIDCQPELVADRVTLPPGMAWRAIPCGFGLGEKARCHPACDRCGGTAGEQLLVFEWSNRL